MSHGTSLKDQSAGKWKAKDSNPLTLLDGGLGRTLCIKGKVVCRVIRYPLMKHRIGDDLL